MPATEERVTRMLESEWDAWAWDHLHRVMSPGGAAMLAGVDRTTIYAWIRRGAVEAWEFRRGEVYVDVGDVIEEAIRLGHRTEREVRRWRRRLETA